MNKYVPIELDKTRNLKMGLRAMSLVENAFDMPFAKIKFEELKLEELMIVLHAGLVHEDEKLTPSKVMDIMEEFGDIEAIFKDLVKAINLGFARKNVQRATKAKK